MSQGLRESLDAMYDARIPQKWLKVSWESATLGFWYTELLEREQQYRIWLRNGRPYAFWMTGFFNPQGFLTAMRQEVTRSHKGCGVGFRGSSKPHHQNEQGGHTRRTFGGRLCIWTFLGRCIARQKIRKTDRIKA
ncbi:dynein heavy chain 8, axonemal-like [Manduca sexta]|uniref:dynein heavy chain 8, axonemal-like n=1 Tax=Manduca sexta TaxID=7130 RepID=UPI00188ECA42|nr:dynein heavy chain 8, axonemal-like [Manduca sexta]